MCGGAIISEYIPQRSAHGSSKRALCAADFWPEAAADFDELAGATYPADQEPTRGDLVDYDVSAVMGMGMGFFHQPPPYVVHDAVPIAAAPEEEEAAAYVQQQQQNDAGMELWTFDDNIGTAVPI
ncbi:hypothetical protein EJB05_10561, partial [Eragrostis curvula]